MNIPSNTNCPDGRRAVRDLLVGRFKRLFETNLGDILLLPKESDRNCAIAVIVGGELVEATLAWLADIWIDAIPVELTMSFKLVFRRNAIRALRAVRDGYGGLWFALVSRDKEGTLQALLLLPVRDYLSLVKLSPALARAALKEFDAIQKNKKKRLGRRPHGDIELQRTVYRGDLMKALLNSDGDCCGQATLLVRKAFLARFALELTAGRSVLVFDDETRSWTEVIASSVEADSLDLAA